MLALRRRARLHTRKVVSANARQYRRAAKAKSAAAVEKRKFFGAHTREVMRCQVAEWNTLQTAYRADLTTARDMWGNLVSQGNEKLESIQEQLVDQAQADWAKAVLDCQRMLDNPIVHCQTPHLLNLRRREDALRRTDRFREASETAREADLLTAQLLHAHFQDVGRKMASRMSRLIKQQQQRNSALRMRMQSIRNELEQQCERHAGYIRARHKNQCQNVAVQHGKELTLTLAQVRAHLKQPAKYKVVGAEVCELSPASHRALMRR